MSKTTTEFKVGDNVKISKTSEYYDYGTLSNPKILGKIKNIEPGMLKYDIHVLWDNDIDNDYNKSDLDKVNLDEIWEIIENLSKIDSPITSLDVKRQLRINYPKQNWVQEFVSSVMDRFYKEGKLSIIDDNGTYRTYCIAKSVPAQPKMTVVKFVSAPIKISRMAAIKLMEENKGKIFSAVFVTKSKGETRRTCRFLNTTPLGYIRVTDMAKTKKEGSSIINLNIQTLSELKIKGQKYLVK